MRLLKKSEIAAAKNLDLFREQQEGMKLAKRVDSLREVQAREERELELFRLAAVSRLNEELSALEKKKVMATENLARIEEKLEATLSKTEQRALDDMRKSLDDRDKHIKELLFELNLREIDIAASIQEAEDRLQAQKMHESQAEALHTKALEEKGEASATLATARSLEENIAHEKVAMENKVALRETLLSQKEQEMQNQTKENIKISKELAKERMQLADQRITLERAMERLKKLR